MGNKNQILFYTVPMGIKKKRQIGISLIKKQ